MIVVGKIEFYLNFQEEQRKEIEHKLEEKAKQEKEELQKERRQLFLDRRHRQAKVKMIEQKMEIAKIVSKKYIVS